MPITDNDISSQLQAQVQEAIASKSPLAIHSGKSKLFYGNIVDANPLDVSQHSGVINYEPTELCITVRAGTRLTELVELLSENQQILPFEPPIYTSNSTIGGAIATGISGPRRAYTGSVRDAILGVQIINGHGEIVNFGGQVMKNVAGYDLSRLMVRSQGTLGVILSVSIRLLPKPSHDLTLSFNATQAEALTAFRKFRTQQLPISATTWFDNQASIRLSASQGTLEASRKNIDAEEVITDTYFWNSIRDHQHAFFTHNDKPLWRFSLPPSAHELVKMDNELLIEWGGAQRWVQSNAPANIMQSVAKSHSGYATLFRSNTPDMTHAPVLEPALLELHRRLKRKMDPQGIFNPNKIYRGL